MRNKISFNNNPIQSDISMLSRLALSVILVLLFTPLSNAQQCGPCKKRPSVAGFDFDIQVAAPNVNDSTHNLWPEWKALFLIAPTVSSKLFTANNACIKFTRPPSYDSGDTTLLSVGGETFTNLPSNHNISSNLAVYGDYYYTGHINSQSDQCVLFVEVKSACNKKTVTTAQVTFQFANITGNLASIAEQVSQQLSPLADKINLFEKKERSANHSLSIDHFSSDPITVTPIKKTLKAGESTPVHLQLKDCDGEPLGGREIIFNETNFEGFALHKTIGGTVSPAKVVTDAQGKASVVFTLNSGAREAVINAHSPGKDVRGCGSIFTGSAPINIRAIYSGYVKYRYSNATGCTETKINGCLKSWSTSQAAHDIEYMASFYVEGDKSSSLYAAFSSDEKDNAPGAIPNSLDAGIYNHTKNNVLGGTIICESAEKGNTTIQRTRHDNAGNLKHSGMSVSADENNVSISLSLTFELKTNYLFQQTARPAVTEPGVTETNWDVVFDSLVDKELQFKKIRIGNRTQYSFEITRNVNVGCTTNSSETVKIVIWVE